MSKCLTLAAAAAILTTSITAPVTAQSSLLYVLQLDQVTLEQLTQSRFEWLILEPSLDPEIPIDFSPAQIHQIKHAGPCDKALLAYLSIGEAESYRGYFDPNWIDASGDPIPGIAPPWLGPTNPDWEDNYKARYWDPNWQNILWGTPATAPLDRIIDQGFDGVYLDIVDAYYFWSDDPEGIPERTRAQARTEMIDLIEAIANYARITRNRPEFLVVPQNAADIIRNDDYELDTESDRYFAAISAIGQEDLFFDETAAQPTEETDYTLEQLREFAARDKPVFVTDYIINAAKPTAQNNANRAAAFYDNSVAEGFIPYAAVSDRALDEIFTFAAPGWPVAQPAPGCAPPPFDIDGSGAVDAQDLRVLLVNFTTSDPASDLDNSGSVDLADLRLLFAAFGIHQQDYPKPRKFYKALSRAYKAAIRDGMERTRRQRKHDKRKLRDLARPAE